MRRAGGVLGLVEQEEVSAALDDVQAGSGQTRGENPSVAHR
jgi:hypothetical protein